MKNPGVSWHLAAAGFAALVGVFAPAVSAEVVRAVQYYHPVFEHYFVTANPLEIAALDAGQLTFTDDGMLGGWLRTGLRYRVDDAPAPDLAPVCRFYTSAFAGKASHFYTASAVECEQVKANPAWTFEGVAFYARVPDAANSCSAGTAAILRLYNNGSGGAPNHAYVADTAKRDALLNAGWISEGAAFCTPLAAEDPFAQTQVLAGSTWGLPSQTATGSKPVFPFESNYFNIVTHFPGAPFAGQVSYFGISLQPAVIHDEGNPRIGSVGSAAWDPLAGSYIYVSPFAYFCTGLDGYCPDAGTVWTFDDARGPTAAACTMTVAKNWSSPPPSKLHSFQPFLLLGCTPGIAKRL